MRSPVLPGGQASASVQQVEGVEAGQHPQHIDRLLLTETPGLSCPLLVQPAAPGTASRPAGSSFEPVHRSRHGVAVPACAVEASSRITSRSVGVHPGAGPQWRRAGARARPGVCSASLISSEPGPLQHVRRQCIRTARRADSKIRYTVDRATPASLGHLVDVAERLRPARPAAARTSPRRSAASSPPPRDGPRTLLVLARTHAHDPTFHLTTCPSKTQCLMKDSVSCEIRSGR